MTYGRPLFRAACEVDYCIHLAFSPSKNINPLWELNQGPQPQSGLSLTLWPWSLLIKLLSFRALV